MLRNHRDDVMHRNPNRYVASANRYSVPIGKKERVRWLQNVQQSTELLGDPG